MKILVISDIHGDINSLNKILDYEQFDYIFVLGDLGNDLVINRLNDMKGILTCVKGNCDYINNLFETPKFKYIELDNKKFVLTHGDLFNENILEVKQIYIQGHTHKSMIKILNNKYYLNPGSISLPRDNTKSYILIDGNYILLKDLDFNIIQKIEII